MPEMNRVERPELGADGPHSGDAAGHRHGRNRRLGASVRASQCWPSKLAHDPGEGRAHDERASSTGMRGFAFTHLELPASFHCLAKQARAGVLTVSGGAERANGGTEETRDGPVR